MATSKKETKELKSGDKLTIGDTNDKEVTLLTKVAEGWLCNVTTYYQNGGAVQQITGVEILTEKELNA